MSLYERDRLSGKHQAPHVYKGPPKHRERGDGRVVTSHGYVTVYVGKGHPEANRNGFAYEHRLVAAQSAGRMLLPGEEVHHKNEDKGDNPPENLEICFGHAEHALRHRSRHDLRMPGEDNPTISCQCGCGEKFDKYDDVGRPRRFVPGHHAKMRRAPARESLLGMFVADRTRHVTSRDVADHVGCSLATAKGILLRAADAGIVVRAKRGSYVVSATVQLRTHEGGRS